MSAGPALRVSGVVLPEGETRDLWIRDGVVSAEPVPGAETVARGWIVPGLVDAHCHVGLDADGPSEDPDVQRAQAEADRDGGALLIRDCGSPVDTRWMDHEPDLPRLIRAGRHLAPPKRYVRGLAIELEPARLPDQVEVQARYGDGWVKLVGDWIDRDLGDLAPTWPADILATAIARAHAVGARVTAHTFGEEALPDLLAAGIDCVEHGTGLTEDLVEVMARRGTALVPTLINVANFPEIADGATRFPTYAARMRRLHGTAYARVRAAYEAGVPVFAGTDAGGNVAHGRIADEIRALHEAGLSAEDALGAASWRAREWLGRPGLEPGAPADLVVYAADPRADLSTVAEPVRVVLGGRVIA